MEPAWLLLPPVGGGGGGGSIVCCGFEGDGGGILGMLRGSLVVEEGS